MRVFVARRESWSGAEVGRGAGDPMWANICEEEEIAE